MLSAKVLSLISPGFSINLSLSCLFLGCCPDFSLILHIISAAFGIDADEIRMNGRNK